MRWLGVLLLMVIWVLLPTPIMAQTSDTVTVTASGWVVEAPGDFTLTYISDYEVGITWTKPATANNTMVRASYNGYPATRAEGYLVYYGTASSASDNTVNLDETATPVYYRAWSEHSTEGWSPQYAQDNIGGAGVTLIALALLALGLTVAMFATRNAMLGYPSVIMWAVLGAFAYTESDTPWGDWQYFLFFACAFGMTIFCALAAYGLRERRDTLADEELERGDEKYIDEGEGESGLEFHSREETSKPSKRTQALRKRAEERRTRL